MFPVLEENKDRRGKEGGLPSYYFHYTKFGVNCVQSILSEQAPWSFVSKNIWGKAMRCIVTYVILYWCVHVVTLLAALKCAGMPTRKLQASEHRCEQTAIFLPSVANFRASAGSSENSGPPFLRRFFNRLSAWQALTSCVLPCVRVCLQVCNREVIVNLCLLPLFFFILSLEH